MSKQEHWKSPEAKKEPLRTIASRRATKCQEAHKRNQKLLRTKRHIFRDKPLTTTADIVKHALFNVRIDSCVRT